MKSTNSTTYSKPVTLDSPIVRGEQVIEVVELRKPSAGELRGISLSELLQLDVTALQKVIPRLSKPTLTEADIQQLDPADLLQLGTEVASFLLPKALKPEASLVE